MISEIQGIGATFGRLFPSGGGLVTILKPEGVKEVLALIKIRPVLDVVLISSQSLKFGPS